MLIFSHLQFLRLWKKKKKKKTIYPGSILFYVLNM